LNGHIDLEDVVGYVEPYGLLLVWERSFPIFEKWKERYNNPKAFEGFEFLVNEIKKTYPNITLISNPQRQRLMQ